MTVRLVVLLDFRFMELGNDEEKNGTQVAWKNLNILTKDLGKYSKPMALPAKKTLNQLTDVEAKDGWKMLWDG